MCWWQGDIAGMAPAYARGGRDLAGHGRQSASSRTPSTTTRSRSRCPTWSRRSSLIDGDPYRRGRGAARGGPRRSFARSATSAARRTCCGAWATCSTSRTRSIPGPRTCASRWRSSASSATARWRPGRCTCSAARLLRMGRLDEARRDLRQALRVFHDASDAAGITLVFDDLSSQAIADEDLERAARLWGAAREPHRRRPARAWRRSWTRLSSSRPDRTSGTSSSRPSSTRSAREGAAMSLDDIVAYALDVPSKRCERGAD